MICVRTGADLCTFAFGIPGHLNMMNLKYTSCKNIWWYAEFFEHFNSIKLQLYFLMYPLILKVQGD